MGSHKYAALSLAREKRILYENELCVVDVQDRTSPAVMHQVRAPVTTQEICSKAYTDNYHSYGEEIPDIVLCAGLPRGTASACWVGIVFLHIVLCMYLSIILTEQQQ